MYTRRVFEGKRAGVGVEEAGNGACALTGTANKRRGVDKGRKQMWCKTKTCNRPANSLKRNIEGWKEGEFLVMG